MSYPSISGSLIVSVLKRVSSATSETLDLRSSRVCDKVEERKRRINRRSCALSTNCSSSDVTLPLDTKLLSLSFEAIEIDAESKIERRVIQEVLMIRNDFVVSEERREIPSHSFAETEFYSNPMDGNWANSQMPTWPACLHF